jgi:hypothetical protein
MQRDSARVRAHERSLYVAKARHLNELERRERLGSVVDPADRRPPTLFLGGERRKVLSHTTAERHARAA